jgi:metal-responsive CopG/Arc/MetJ family transcriptional regulator
MTTIAITIDHDLLGRLDALVRTRRGTASRSRLVREAVREYVARAERLMDEQREAAVLHRHRRRLARQARALVRLQATP